MALLFYQILQKCLVCFSHFHENTHDEQKLRSWFIFTHFIYFPSGMQLCCCVMLLLQLDIHCCITNSLASVENSGFTCAAQLTFLCHVRYRYYPFYYLKLLSRTTTCFFFLEIKAELEYICWLSKPGETGHFNTGQDGNSPCSSSSYYNKILCFTLIPSRPRKNSVQTRKLARSDLNKSLKE